MREIIKMKAIYELLEAITDRCVDVANLVEGIVAREFLRRGDRLRSACGCVVFLVVLALAFDFMNGFHDAANSIATVVSTRRAAPDQAVLLRRVLQLRRDLRLPPQGRRPPSARASSTRASSTTT